MQGKIIKGIAGFYYVHVEGAGVFECKAKGIFRKEKIKPLVGDNVEVALISQAEKTGNIVQILKRKNKLARPAVANIDQALVIFAADKPKPNFNLLNRFLVLMEQQQVGTVICFNKQDLVNPGELSRLQEIYGGCGYQVIFASAKDGEGIGEIHKALEGKTTTVAGPSGVGKSSLINLLQPEAGMEVGDISEKIARGKHTTRHSQLIHIQGQAYIVDTPGFSSIYLSGIGQQELKLYFREFQPFEGSCRFQGCSHIHEPGCSVKQALEEGKVSPMRYGDYALLYEELKHGKKYGRGMGKEA